MPRLDRLSELQRKSSLAHPCLLNDSAPFTRLQRPLSDSRLALVTTAGIHLRGDAPFTGGDPTFRAIPADTAPSEIVQSHSSIGGGNGTGSRGATASLMRAAFALLDRDTAPVLEDYPDDIYSGQDINLAQASSVSPVEISGDVAFEVTTLRPYYEQWVAAHAERTAVGVTRVDQRRFRGLVRLLEAYAEDRDVDVPEWNKDVPLPQFVRYASDDLKAFYLEARMQQVPAASFQELNAWLWTETALSNLLRAVRDRMRAQGDPKLDAIAFGIAR